MLDVLAYTPKWLFRCCNCTFCHPVDLLGFSMEDPHWEAGWMGDHKPVLYYFLMPTNTSQGFWWGSGWPDGCLRIDHDPKSSFENCMDDHECGWFAWESWPTKLIWNDLQSWKTVSSSLKAINKQGFNGCAEEAAIWTLNQTYAIYICLFWMSSFMQPPC